MSATFDSLVRDLTRDYQRAQPRDALQFCATWFQTRLEEQRTRMRDTLSQRAPSVSVPRDLYADSHGDSSSMPPPTSAPAPRPRSSFRDSIAQSPFGTLNVPGNALLTTGDITPPSLRFSHNELPPTSPLTTSNPSPFGSFDPSASNDEFLAPGHPIFARRTSISAESIAIDSGADEILPVYPKDEDQRRRIKEAIRQNFIFRDLNEEQERAVLDAMQERSVVKNELIIRQGDVGEYFYVVASGQFNCYIRPEPLPPNWLSQPNILEENKEKFTQPKFHPELGTLVQECKPGKSFGDLALMYGHPRAASVLALEASTVWSLDRTTFRTIVLRSRHRTVMMYESFLSTVPLLSSLGAAERSKIADALQSKDYHDGEVVVQQGDIGDTFFFVEEGEAIATKKHTTEDGQTKEVQVGYLKKGDYFGELALLRAAPRAATVSAVHRSDSSQPKLKVAALDEAAFTRLLGPLRELMERKAGESYRLPLNSR
ncbi:camp-dependent protein kinase regulatory subunit [Coprinopsis sp. MPI-PUGE-AT-0042]|nr:camp-dependent protein kinase regulatory subunit [Coprinopsis sp. MPI-PUGE-AT-0042]